MSEELRECPFCGGELMFCPSHVEGQYIVNKPCGVCEKCGMTFIGIGYRVSGEVKSEDFNNNKFFALWNTRPAEDALKEENERLKDRVKRLEFLLSKIQKTSTPHIGGISVCQAELRAINRWCKLALGDGNNSDTGKGGRG